ncbi:MAG: hypothetical protein SH850_28775, partial [Planctomycetaceae bacterium]|nr:hypothetical protein [Planctomycetaceae bacterium]
MSAELVQLLTAAVSEIGQLQEAIKDLQSRVAALESHAPAAHEDAAKVSAVKTTRLEHPGKAGAIASVVTTERHTVPSNHSGIKVFERPPQPMFVPPSPDAVPPPLLRPELFEPVDL